MEKKLSTSSFPHPLDRSFYSQPLISRREQHFRSFSSAVREKPHWATKMDDPTIFRKWVDEARAQEMEASTKYKDYIQKPIACWLKEDADFIRGELEVYREWEKQHDIVPGIDCVWKADGIIPEELKRELLEQVRRLEDVPDHKKDWHPGSDKQVLDIVHPSLFPVVYGRSLYNDGTTIPRPATAGEVAEISDTYDPKQIDAMNWDNLWQSDDEGKDDPDFTWQWGATGPNTTYRTLWGYDIPGYSSQFQWLPSEFSIGQDGKTKILSYINNLNTRRQRADFYPVIEKVFEKFVPLFNRVLGDLDRGLYSIRRVNARKHTVEDPADIIFNPLWKQLITKMWDDDIPKEDKLSYPDGKYYVWDTSSEAQREHPSFRLRAMKAWALSKGGFVDHDADTFPKEFVEGKDPKSLISRAFSGWGRRQIDYSCGGKYKTPKNYGFNGAWIPADVEDEIEDDEGGHSWYCDGRKPNFVDLWALGELTGDKWTPPSPSSYLNGKTIKVIVKMANIVLTPDKPEYDGGSWHVEAMLNERIVATGIYYYSQSNITASTLSFRQVSNPPKHSQGQHTAGRVIWNMPRGGMSTQLLGSVVTKEDRMIAFPNIFQHKVSPFRLVDPEKPGYRKILVFFLCDPSEAGKDVTSTRDIAPQDPPSVAVRDAHLRREEALGRLPEEIFQKVMGLVKEKDPPISWEDARNYREDLMKERSKYNKVDQKVAGMGYSLCEH